MNSSQPLDYVREQRLPEILENSERILYFLVQSHDGLIWEISSWIWKNILLHIHSHIKLQIVSKELDRLDLTYFILIIKYSKIIININRIGNQTSDRIISSSLLALWHPEMIFQNGNKTKATDLQEHSWSRKKI